MYSPDDNNPLLIIDGYGFVFRAYHVQPPLTSPSGAPVGAIYGFTSMLIKIIGDFKPTHAVVVLDHSGKNFRHDLYKDYKANRPPLPEDLIAQLKLVQTTAEALNFKCLSKQGFEADDIIATLAVKASSLKRKSIIISSDKDLMQLVDEHIAMYDPVKAKFIKEEDIFLKFGVKPEKVREVQALIGDSSDNIPGVAGIGPKTAAQLINEYGDLDNIINSIDKLKPRLAGLILQNKENALISRQLVGLDKEVDVDQDIENFHWKAPPVDNISDFLNLNGFKSLNKRLENLFNIKINSQPVQDKPISEPAALVKNNIEIVKVTSPGQLRDLVQRTKVTGIIAVNKNNIENNVILTIYDELNLYEINYKSTSEDAIEDLFTYSDSKIEKNEILEIIGSLFADTALKKITYNLKNLLKEFDSELNAFDDLMLMDYILTAGNKSRDIATILGLENPDDAFFKDFPVIYFIECYNKLRKELIAGKALHLYESIDLPLCYILNDMEKTGIKINISYLKKLSSELAVKINRLEQAIYALAGEEFNISSPKQLGVVLFEKMRLPYGKLQGKSATYSTGVEILEKLHTDGYEIAALLLDYRHLTKLKNTYTDALPKLANPRTGRVHTTFLQCATSTGRLSSVNPNVQNIPIRTAEGNKIRAAFITSEGFKLISADYSQIELRILSRVANIDSLKESFAQGQDIHARTASEIFDIPLSNITPEIRRKAKAINFGIIYGISAFGLAKQLGISNKESSEYIDKYFKKYPGIQKYMSETIEFARTNNYVENLLGRKCFIPTINNKNHALRAFGERAAINAPMQSLASDIVKIATINLSRTFKTQKLKTKPILQIHDELIFESPDNEVEAVTSIIKSVMENILPELNLHVQVNSGLNWQLIH